MQSLSARKQLMRYAHILHILHKNRAIKEHCTDLEPTVDHSPSPEVEEQLDKSQESPVLQNVLQKELDYLRHNALLQFRIVLAAIVISQCQ